MSDEYYAGKGCKCAAHAAFECCCSGVDWTDPEVYRLRKENTELRKALKEVVFETGTAQLNCIIKIDKAYWIARDALHALGKEAQP